MDLLSTAKLLLKICSSVSPSFQTTESMRWKLVSIICLTKHYQDRCDNWSPLSRWPFLQRFTSCTLKIQIRHNETGREEEIHFYRPSICSPLINVSAVEIERPHFSVFIRPGWTQSCRPFNVQTHTELIEDKSRLKFRQHGKLSTRIPTDGSPRVGTNTWDGKVQLKTSWSLVEEPQLFTTECSVRNAEYWRLVGVLIPFSLVHKMHKHNENVFGDIVFPKKNT